MKKKPMAQVCIYCELAPKLLKNSNMYRYECPKCFIHTPPFKTNVKARGYWNKFRKNIRTQI